ncbi:MAG TPA: hypothetical protein VMV83_05040 [Rectinemataceae bacterium]|nr:hypothetical protein [Rectinemataceae bacterium]
MKWFMGLAFVLLLGGCSASGPFGGSAGVSRVIIRDSGEIATTYQVSGDGKTLSASTTDRGMTVTRSYSYDSGGRLVAVTRRAPSLNDETIVISNVLDPAHNSRLTRTIKTNSSSSADFQYYYETDGSMAGIVSIDPNGNLQAKAARQ